MISFCFFLMKISLSLFFCTMNSFFRILEKTSFELICTQLYTSQKERKKLLEMQLISYFNSKYLNLQKKYTCTQMRISSHVNKHSRVCRIYRIWTFLMWEILLLDFFDLGDFDAGLFWCGRFCCWTFLM